MTSSGCAVGRSNISIDVRYNVTYRFHSMTTSFTDAVIFDGVVPLTVHLARLDRPSTWLVVARQRIPPRQTDRQRDAVPD